MASLAAPPPWIPEDDLLLKNAVEAGASLEALAKGAVRFSRRFTVKEIKDRWHSLLYDPLVSAEASARMVEVEASTKKSGNNKETDEAHIKRKYESVCKLYYSMRKRFCNQVSEPDYLALYVGNYINNNGFGDEHQDGTHDGVRETNADILHHELIVNPESLEDDSTYRFIKKDVYKNLPEDQLTSSKQLGRDYPKSSLENKGAADDHALSNLHAVSENFNSSHSFGNTGHLQSIRGSTDHFTGFSSPHHPRTPLWETIGDISAPVLPLNDPDENVSAVGKAGVLSSDASTKEISIDRLGVPGTVTQNGLLDFSDCLLNLANEMDVDGKEIVNEGYNQSIGTPILNCSVNKNEPSDTILGETQSSYENRCSVNQDAEIPGRLSPVLEKVNSYTDSQCRVSSLEVDGECSTLQQKPQFHGEIYGELMMCTLNTEDPEIPCNDDFPTSSSSLVKHQNHRESGGLASFSADREEQNLSHIKEEENVPKLYMDCQIDAALNRTLVSFRAKSDSDLHVSALSRKAVGSHANASPSKISAGASYSAKDVASGKESFDAYIGLDIEGDSTNSAIPCTDESPLRIDEEDNEYEYDIPSFEDIEAMILDMDLSPPDGDSFMKKEVSRYAQEDSRRAIIRLEQCARSSINRSIASRGALAFLYGHHSRHYIKKAEVILGRSTDDFDVDIDLARGGNNKISRRQALIKMEGDGSFFLKNLAKTPMFLNGKEVSAGMRAHLSSSSLIEVKGLAFVFEINQRYVSQYLAKLVGENRQGISKFEWSHEGVP